MNGCAFISGDPKARPLAWCGRATRAGKPYCDEHWDLTHIAPQSVDAQRKLASFRAIADANFIPAGLE